MLPYIVAETVFKIVRAVCYYTGEVAFIFQYYEVNMRIKRITSGGPNTLTVNEVRKTKIMKVVFLILLIGLSTFSDALLTDFIIEILNGTTQ